MAEKFTQHTGRVVPLDAANVDTDAIIPKQFLQKVTRTGFGAHLFNDWRFLDDKGEVPNPEFVLNFQEYKGASILLARENFGCGSSREHAPWALTDYGFKVVIAPSFADIFYGNSFNNQLLPVTLSDEQVDELFALVQANPGMSFEVDLEAEVVKAGDKSYSFSIDAFRRHCMLNGLDSIGLTLQHEEFIPPEKKNRPVFRGKGQGPAGGGPLKGGRGGVPPREGGEKPPPIPLTFCFVSQHCRQLCFLLSEVQLTQRVTHHPGEDQQRRTDQKQT